MNKTLACFVTLFAAFAYSLANGAAAEAYAVQVKDFTPTPELSAEDCTDKTVPCAPAAALAGKRDPANTEPTAPTRIFVRRTPACNRGAFDTGVDFRLEECHIEKRANGTVAICFGSATKYKRPLEIFIGPAPSTTNNTTESAAENAKSQNAYVIGKYPRTLTSPKRPGPDPCYSVIVY